MRFEFGVGHLDRVQIRTVGWQEEHPVTLCLQTGLGFGGFVRRQVVGDHHVTGLQRWGQLGLDIGVESSSIHWAVQHPRSRQFVHAQACDECLGVPVAEWRVSFQPCAAKGSPPQPGHLGGDGGLVDEHQPVRLEAHPRHPPVPFGSRGAHLLAQPFRRDQGFFYM